MVLDGGGKAGSRELADLERRLRGLEDERAIEAVLVAYGHALDYGDEAAWGACFAPDGVFEVRRADRAEPVLRVEGRAALEAFAARHTRAPDLWHKHVAVDAVVRVDGDRATCRSYMILLVEQDGRPELGVFGRYIDRLVRRDGRWQLSSRVAEIESRRQGIPTLPYGRISER